MENKVLTDEEVLAREQEKVNEINQKLAQPTTALATIQESAIEMLLKADLEMAVNCLEQIEMFDDLEKVEQQYEIFKEAEKKLKADKKVYFDSMDKDKKRIRTLELIFEKKKKEADDKIAELKLEETMQKIADTKIAFKEYYEEKEHKSFDFVDYQFVIAYIEQKHRDQNNNKEMDYSVSKWTTAATGKLAKPGKDLIDAVVQKFANDFLVIMQGEEAHVTRKLELYQLNKYNIEETITAFNKWLEDERIKREEIQREADRIARETIEKEEAEKLQRENARKKAEQKQEENQAIEKAEQEQEQKQAEQVEQLKDKAEQVEISAPTITVHEKKEVKEDLVTTCFKATGKLEDLKLLIGYAKSLNVDIQKMEEN